MSSVLKRLFRREGSSKLEFTSTINKNAPPTFVPKIIRGKYWIVTDLDHLDMVAKQDPIANFIVYGVPEMIFDDGFMFVDEKGDETATNKQIQHELRRLNANKVFIQCLAAARNFGFCYLYTGKNKFIPKTPEGGRIASLRCFTPRECTVHEYWSEKSIEEAKKTGVAVGDVRTYKLTLNVGKGGSIVGHELFLPADDFIVWERGPTRSSVLEPIWDMLVYIRYLFHSMTFYDIKIGHGLFVAYTEAGYGETEKGKWNTAFQDISIKRALMVDKSEISEIKFIGPSGSVTNFVEHIDMCIQTLSVPTNIPKELLMGAAAGAVTGSETNIKLGDEQERKIKSSVEEYIREVIKRMGWDILGDLFEWIEKTAHTEEDRAKIEQAHTQAQGQRLTYMTIDEVRAIDKLPPLPDGRGDKLASEGDPLSEFSKAFGDKPNEQEPQNPAGENI